METFNIGELAKYLKVHTFVIRRLVREGKTSSFKVGGQWWFQKDQIDQWSRSRAVNNYGNLRGGR